MITDKAFPARQRRGLTLIELLVVLMILIALAGLLAPMLPSMLTRAHDSTCATNITSTAQAIIQYQQLYSSYPNNFDALTDGTNMINYFANGAACPPQYLDPAGASAGPGNLEVQQLTLTAAEAAALTGVGITNLQAMVATPGTAPGNGNPFDPTFNYYSAALPTTGAITIGTGTVFAGMDPTNAGVASTTYARCVAMNLPVTGRYIILGIGPRCSLIGKTVQTPPVHFADQPVINPEYGYMRFCAIFKISDSAVGGNFTQAQLVGVAPIMDNGLGTVDDHLQSWYQLTNGGS
jgi:prepilin-type N-terminal cleavage/methylation domain-containing protein